MTKTDTPCVDRGDYVEFAVVGQVYLIDAFIISQKHGFFTQPEDYRVRNGMTTWKCEKKGVNNANATNGD